MNLQISHVPRGCSYGFLARVLGVSFHLVAAGSVLLGRTVDLCLPSPQRCKFYANPMFTPFALFGLDGGIEARVEEGISVGKKGSK